MLFFIYPFLASLVCRYVAHRRAAQAEAGLAPSLLRYVRDVAPEPRDPHGSRWEPPVWNIY